MSRKFIRTLGKAAAVVGGVALVASGIGAALGGTMMLSVLGTSVAASAIASAAGVISAGASLLGKQKPPTLNAATQDRLQLSLDPYAPRIMAFGETALATDLRDQEYTGADKEYLHRFVVAAAHKIHAFKEVWFDDQLAWSAAGGVTAAYAGYLQVTPIVEGTAGNAINIGSRMGSSRRFTGCAYLHFRFKLTGNSKKTESPFAQQVPTRLTVIGEAIPCYDPRQDSTVPGGSGTHRANNQATWTWGEHCHNLALQYGTYLLGWRIQNPQSGTWKLSVGAGTAPDRIDWGSFIEGANLCDEAVALAGGGSERRYIGGGLVADNEDPPAVTEAFKAAMNADVDDQDGLTRLTVFHNDLAAPVATFTEADVENDYVWRQTKSPAESFNVVRGRYVEPAALFQMAPYRETRVAPRGTIDRVHPADFRFVQRRGHAERLTKQKLQRELYGGELRATFLATGWKVQKNSVVVLSFAPEGFAGKKFRVSEYENARRDGRVPMVLREEHADIYAWDTEESAAVELAEPTEYLPGEAPIPQFLGTIEEGADVTAGHISAGIDGQGMGATANSLADLDAGAAALLADLEEINDAAASADNLIPNATLKSGIAAWAFIGSVTRQAAVAGAPIGAFFRIVGNSANHADGTNFEVSGGEKLFYSAAIKANGTGLSAVARVQFLDATGASLADQTINGNVAAAGTWLPWTATLTVPATAVLANVDFIGQVPGRTVDIGAPRLGRAQSGADITSTATAAAIAGQGLGATANTLAELDAAAAAALTGAQADLTSLSSDGVVTVIEKQTLIARDTQLEQSYQELLTRAGLHGISTADMTTKRTAYLAARNAITSPGWNVTTGASTVNRATFNPAVANYVTAQQTLRASVGAQDRLTANWGNVSGTGRPENNADVTNTHTSAGFTGQGALATKSFADWLTDITGAGKPASNAGSTLTLVDLGGNDYVISGTTITRTSGTGYDSCFTSTLFFSDGWYATCAIPNTTTRGFLGVSNHGPVINQANAYNQMDWGLYFSVGSLRAGGALGVVVDQNYNSGSVAVITYNGRYYQAFIDGVEVTIGGAPYRLNSAGAATARLFGSIHTGGRSFTEINFGPLAATARIGVNTYAAGSTGVLLGMSDLYTPQGIAAGFIGAGTGATANNLSQLNSTEGANFSTLVSGGGSGAKFYNYANVAFVGSSMKKSGGALSDTDAAALALPAYPGAILISAVIPVTGVWTGTFGIADGVLVGTIDAVAINAAFSPSPTSGKLRIIENGAVAAADVGTVTAGMRCTIVFDGVEVFYYVNDGQVRRVTGASVGLTSADICYFKYVPAAVGASIENIVVGSPSDMGRSQSLTTNGRPLTDKVFQTANMLYSSRSRLDLPVVTSWTGSAGNWTANFGAGALYPDDGSTLTLPSGTHAALGNSVTRYRYRTVDDPATAGTSYGIATTAAGAQGTNKVYLGKFTSPASGGGGGSTDPTYDHTDCVSAAAWVEERSRGWILARDVVAGEWLRVLDESTMLGTRWELVENNFLALADGVKIKAANGFELSLSDRTPVTLRDGSVCWAANAWMHEVPCCDATGEVTWQSCTVEPAGEIEVAHISCRASVYAAGNLPGRAILTHNIQYKP